MKVIVAGLGSMGKRRMRCLEALGHTAILGIDPREDRRKEAARRHGVNTAAGATVAQLKGADALIISTPPDRHGPWIKKALDAGIPCFVEASVVLSDLPDLLRISRSRKVLVFPSCTMRYFAGPKAVRSALRAGAIGTPLSFIYQSGQYLPDWHPWEKVSDFYVSNAATGGCREIVPFELAWLTWAFGPLARPAGQSAKLDDFGRGVEDIYQVAGRFGKTLGLLQIDVLSRLPVRRLTVEGARGRLTWDQYGPGGPSLSVFSRSGEEKKTRLIEKSRTRKGINSDRPYIDELSDFLACVGTGRKPAYTLADDVTILKNLESIRKACR